MPVAPVPPQNLEAEESVLGAIMLNKNVLGNVTEVVGPGDFYRESHATIYRAFIEMDASDIPIDSISTADWLDEHGTLEQAGGKDRVHELAGLVPATMNAPHYARIVRDMAQLRALISAGSEIARLGWDRPGEIENLNDRAEQLIFQATQEAYRGDLELLDRAAQEMYERVER